MHLARSATRLAPRGLPVVRPLLASALHAMFGQPFAATQDPGDPGLFGPGSATWRLLGEPCVMPMGFRALSVQLLHPIALDAVVTHGSFQEDFQARMERTATYLQHLNFGSTDEALQASAIVQAIHRRVRGETGRGESYSAGDPHYLAWVGMTFTESTLAMHEAFGLEPVDAATADRWVAEQAVGNALLDPRVDVEAIAADPDARAALRAGELDLPLIDEGWVPTDVAGLEARLDEFGPELELRTLGRRSFDALLDPPGLAAHHRAIWRVLVASTLCTLPARWRDVLELSAPGRREQVQRAAFRAFFAGFRVAHGPLSPRLAAEARVRRTPPDGVAAAA